MTLAIGHNNSGLSAGPQDQQEGSTSELLTPVVQGALSVSGQDINIAQVLSVEVGTGTFAGSDFGLVIQNSTKNLVTITDISKQGTEITIFDALSLVTPAIGDIFWVPTTSTDGGTFTLETDGTFTIGAPTSGSDTLLNVLFYDSNLQEWHGPTTLSVVDAPNRLEVLPNPQPAFAGSDIIIDFSLSFDIGTLSVQGSTVGLPLSTTPGTAVIAGQDITIRNNLGIAGVLDLQGRDIAIDSNINVLTGHVPFQGQDIDLYNGIKLRVEVGTPSVQGRDILLTAENFIDPIGDLYFVGLDIPLNIVVPQIPNVDPFVIPDKTNIDPGLQNVISDPFVVPGNGSTALISISGDPSSEYRVNQGPWQNTSSVLSIGDTVQVRMNAGTTYNTAVSTTLLIGEESETYTVTTKSALVLDFRTRDLEVA